MLINITEMIVLFALVVSFWIALWTSGSAARAHPARDGRLPSATERHPDAGLHLCRRGIAPFLKHPRDRF